MKERKTLARVNTRVREYQQKFIKAEAKRKNKTEGEIIREIVDFYIDKTQIKK